VLPPLLWWTKSDFQDFLGEAIPATRDKTSKLSKSSEIAIQKKKTD
jgi:hypothetical protein